MPEPNGFSVSLFQRNNAVKNSKCMASKSIQNFWWYENIVFRVLFFNQLKNSFKGSQDIWLTYKCSQPIRMFRFQFVWKKLKLPPPSFPNNPNFFLLKLLVAKRSTFPRHCLTENMAWGTYITDDAAQKIQAWISYRRVFQNTVQNGARVIGAQWFPLKGRNWMEVIIYFAKLFKEVYLDKNWKAIW